MSSLDDRLDADYAEAWRPQPGEKLVGEVVALTEREGAFGLYPVLTVRRDDGSEAALHAFHTVAASRLAEAAPKVGERIGVKYEGERDGAERKYHSYRVVVDRQERPLDWSRYAEDAPADVPASDVPAETEGLPRVSAPLGEGDSDGPPF